MSPTSCLEAVVRRVGGLSTSLSRDGGRLTGKAVMRVSCAFGFTRKGGMEAAAERKGGMSCAFGLVCSTSLGEECLWASDQAVITVDGGRVYVTKTS